MVAAGPNLDFLAFSLDRRRAKPLHRQLYELLIGQILAKKLTPGMRLPSTRALSQSLSISRNTVILAYEQLNAEGYIEGQPGSGSYVGDHLPVDLPEILTTDTVPAARAKQPPRQAYDSTRFLGVPISLRQSLRPVPFRTNYPALDAFPAHLWARLTARTARRLATDRARALLGEGDAHGHRPLREAIAERVETTRGVRCTARNIVIFAGGQQALYVALHVLLGPGEAAWFEDPCFPGVPAVLAAIPADPHPVPVDGEGLDVAAGEAECPEARVAYVCPSKQFPLGVTMSLRRRLQLLEWAYKKGAWIIEDDYDSEFRFSGHPIPSLQGLDHSGCVIYLGTFSKALFPSIRLGFAVVPDSLIDPFIGARAIMGRFSPLLEQVLLTDFIVEGHFDRHVRRMRKLYGARQDLLLAAVERHLGHSLRMQPTDAGMQAVGWFTEPIDMSAVTTRARERGLELADVNQFSSRRRLPAGLVLGFSAFDEAQINQGVRTLADIVRSAGSAPRTHGRSGARPAQHQRAKRDRRKG
jgi:GntR family transcriptional regulator/MocR family aminotransferase